jgi:hypothetical protein
MSEEETQTGTEETQTETAPVAEVVVEEPKNTSPWADNWREAIAGEDEKELSQLGRYASPKDIWTKARSLEQKLSSGEFKSAAPYPVEGSDADKAAWRTENGLPKEPSGYELAQEIAEEDKGVIDEFKQFSFERGATPAEVQRAVDWFYYHQEQEASSFKEADDATHQATEDELRAEWGNDYRAHLNRMENFLSTAPEGVKDTILNARTPDGALLKDNPDAVRFLVDTALTIDPASTLTPVGSDGKAGSIADEMAVIQSKMGDKNGEYWKGPMSPDGQNTVMQRRYLDLAAAQEQMNKRG